MARFINRRCFPLFSLLLACCNSPPPPQSPEPTSSALVVTCAPPAKLSGGTCVSACPAAAPVTLPAPKPVLTFVGGANVSALSLNGDARLVTQAGLPCAADTGTCLIRLAQGEGQGFGRSSVFGTAPVPVNEFHFVARVRIRTASSSPADGFTLTIQGEGAKALGGTGGGLGFGPDPVFKDDPVRGARISRSIGIKFDLWNNEGEGVNSTGLYLNGAPPTDQGAVDLTGSGIDLHADHDLEITLDHDGVELTQTVKDLVTSATFTTTYTVNVAKVIGATSGYVGFTGATGASSVDVTVGTFGYAESSSNKCVATCPAGMIVRNQVCVEACPAAAPLTLPAPNPMLTFIGGANVSDVSLNGDARLVTEAGLPCAADTDACLIRLAQDEEQGFGRSSVFGTTPVPVNEFHFVARARIRTASSSPADGFTLTIQAEGAKALGGTGGGLGFGPDPFFTNDPVRGARISRSVGIKFDLWNNQGEGVNSTGLYVNGASPTDQGAVDLTGSGIDLHADHDLEITLDHNGVELTQTIKDLVTNATFTTTYTVNVTQVIGATSGYVGFTGATGASSVDVTVGTFSYVETINDKCVTTCPAGMVIHDQVCVNACPAVAPYLSGLTCLASCPVARVGNRCVDACPADLPFLDLDGACVASCASGLHYQGRCVSACPDEAPEVGPNGGCVVCNPLTLNITSPVAVGAVAYQGLNFTAVATSAVGTPRGVVRFSADGVTIGTAPLIDGVASFYTARLGTGSHTIVATRTEGAGFCEASSPPVIQAVAKGSVSLAVSPDPATAANPRDGFKAIMTAIAPSTTHDGYAWGVDMQCIDSGPGGVGLYPCATPPAKPDGTHQFTARYLGNANFLPAEATITYVVPFNLNVPAAVSAGLQR